MEPYFSELPDGCFFVGNSVIRKSYVKVYGSYLGSYVDNFLCSLTCFYRSLMDNIKTSSVDSLVAPSHE